MMHADGTGGAPHDGESYERTSVGVVVVRDNWRFEER